MSYELTNKIKDLKPYLPHKYASEIRLDANESYLSPPDLIKSKISSAVSEVTLNRYPDPLATNAVDAFANFHKIKAEYLTAGNGSDELLSILFNSFLQKNDIVVSLSPDFSMYPFYAHLAECEHISIQKRSDFTFDIDELIKTVNSSGAKMLVFSNPCNPTSLCITKADVRKIITSVKALVILDEAYADFYEDVSLLHEFEKYDNLIVLRTCSKMIGLAGIRLGFAAANTKLTNALQATKSPYNVNAISQAVCATMLSEHEYLSSCREQIIASAKSLYTALSKLQNTYDIKVINTKTNFVVVSLINAKEIADKLAQRNILIRCLGDFIRITAGSESENKAFITAFTEILAESGK